MKKLKLYISIVFTLLFFYSFAVEAEVNCPDQVESFGNTQVQQLYSTKGRRCFLKITPKTSEIPMVYRSFLLTHDGMLMVFNSFSANFDDTSDGAREFYFYTRKFEGFSWFVEGESLIVRGFDQREFKFLLKTAQMQEMSGGDIYLEEKVSPHNAGGLEIIKYEAVYIDAGFRLAGSPSSDRKSTSLVKNPQGQACSLSNGKVYDYISGSVFLKKKIDVKKATAISCPEFVWDEEI